MNESTPNESRRSVELAEHCYDGIQEYDNPTPGWWTWLFIGSIVFSVFYWLYFQTGVEGRSIVDQYNRASAKLLMQKFYDPETGKIVELQPTPETILSYAEQQKWLDFGKVVFDNNCASCHATDGGGLTGPNLTDDNWKHVNRVEDIATVVTKGANNGAMPAWGTRLHPNEVVLVASYVSSLRGTEPARPKQAEGKIIPPWTDSAESSDSESGS